MDVRRRALFPASTHPRCPRLSAPIVGVGINGSARSVMSARRARLTTQRMQPATGSDDDGDDDAGCNFSAVGGLPGVTFSLPRHQN